MKYFIYKCKNKLYILLLILLLNNLYSKYELSNPTNIPELSYINNQSIQILIPKKKCYPTLFMETENKSYNTRNNYRIKKINLKNKNYFVTFYQCEKSYDQYLNLLKENGLIRSQYKYAKNNLFLCSIQNNASIIKEDNNYNLDIYQKVFRYLNSEYLFRKNILYKSYISMKKLYFNDFDYMPLTYNYPDDKELIDNKFKDYILDINDLWLIKPTNLYLGINVEIFKSLKEIKMKEYVITKYITNINLINGKKYDLRLYVLISSLKPLRIYFYKEGLVRIASKKYSLEINSLRDKFIHLTNTNVNYKSKDYKNPIHNNDENSNFWSISMYRKFLKRKNVIWDSIREKIKDIIIKSIISVYKKLIYEIKKNDLSEQCFYNLLGFDLLISNNFTPILIEINKNPNMKILNIIGKQIKTKLFIDTLNLIGINPYSRKTKKPFNFKFNNNKDDYLNRFLCELERPKGDYELIFPSKDNIDRYKKFFINISNESYIDL